MISRFPKTARLTRTAEFRRVREEGDSIAGRNLILGVLRDAAPGEARVGIITSRGLGNAVVRNRVRRRIRELVRCTRKRLKDGCWIVIVARKRAVDTRFTGMKAEWLRLAERASILA